MPELYGKSVFPKLYAKNDKSRETVRSEPLKMKDINTLLSMRFANEPVFDSIDLFISDEYKKAVEENKSFEEIEKIPKFRPATEREANMLFSDLHARDEKAQYSGGGTPGD